MIVSTAKIIDGAYTQSFQTDLGNYVGLKNKKNKKLNAQTEGTRGREASTVK